MKELFIPLLPCMVDHTKPCVDCNLYATNADHLRKVIWHKTVLRIFNKSGIDRPTVQTICDLLFGFEDKYSTVYSDSTNHTIAISPELRDLGRIIAEVRRQFIINLDKIPGYENSECPNFKKNR